VTELETSHSRRVLRGYQSFGAVRHRAAEGDHWYGPGRQSVTRLSPIFEPRVAPLIVASPAAVVTNWVRGHSCRTFVHTGFTGWT
jgi:hypothetical protein